MDYRASACKWDSLEQLNSTTTQNMVYTKGNLKARICLQAVLKLFIVYMHNVVERCTLQVVMF